MSHVNFTGFRILDESGWVVESKFSDRQWIIQNQKYILIVFSGNYFPSFCAGLAYFLTKSSIKKLVYQYKLGRDFLWLDDVFITGVLAEKAGVRLLDIKVRLSGNSIYYS